ncbi:MAG TPA: hypothetical protein VFH68_15300 [Polyangia bacterium]|nr:hypothetical protein [Polyangia bacterium]
MRLAPYLYSIVHSHEMLWELLQLRSERRTAEQDAARLRSRFSFLGSYPSLAGAARQRLSMSYAEYTSTVSPDPIVISLALATFLAVVCDQLRPSSILDLGSGFSSYVFRAYAAGGHAAPAAVVVQSVDQSRPWLDKTRAFLDRQHVDSGGLSTWDDFVSRARPTFDLILQDFSTLDVRLEILGMVVEACRPGGIIIIDDMHVPRYRRAVMRELDRRALSYFSLRAFTRHRLRYAYLVLR